MLDNVGCGDVTIDAGSHWVNSAWTRRAALIVSSSTCDDVVSCRPVLSRNILSRRVGLEMWGLPTLDEEPVCSVLPVMLSCPKMCECAFEENSPDNGNWLKIDASPDVAASATCTSASELYQLWYASVSLFETCLLAPSNPVLLIGLSHWFLPVSSPMIPCHNPRSVLQLSSNY